MHARAYLYFKIYWKVFMELNKWINMNYQFIIYIRIIHGQKRIFFRDIKMKVIPHQIKFIILNILVVMTAFLIILF
jgi:hypothetical protein